MKGKKEVKKAKQGRPLKELLPIGFTKPPREVQPIPALDTTPSAIGFDILPPALCPNWPGDEVALSYDFGLTSTLYFEDDWDYTFPPSFYSFCNNGKILWRFPDDLAPISDSSKMSSKRPSIKKTLTSKEQSKLVAEDTEEDKGWNIVTYIERDETLEELEIRKQKEIEKFATSKKKGKPEEIHIGKVKEVKLSNIELSKSLPLCSRWISGQLQCLKDKGWNYNGEYMWGKIYPQKDGIPIYNPSGKYWVKLWLLGSPRLVEIDSKVPVYDGNVLLPKSNNFRELWPLLLSKAYYKLYSYRWKNTSKYISSPNQELDGSLIYSLCGLMPQHATLDKLNPSDWGTLKALLSDENWDFNYNLITVYCKIDKNYSIPSVSYEEEEEKIPNELDENYKSPDSTHRDTPEHPITKKVSFSNKSKPINAIQGFGYLLTDLFMNSDDFDMRKIQKKEKQKQEEDIKNALMKAKASSPARKLKRHQSPARIRELQKKKAKRGKEKEERRQKLLEPRVYSTYKLIRIKSGISGVPNLNIEAPFTSSEIDEARLRMLNKEYFQNKELEELERLMEEEDIELFDPKDSNEVDIGKVRKEDKLEGLLIPKQRCVSGVWFSAEDFPSVFPEYVIFHEVMHYPYKLFLDDVWKDKAQPYIHNSNYDVWMLDANPQDQVVLIISFSPLIADGSLYPPESVYLIVQKYDFEKESPVKWDNEVKLETTGVIASSYNIPGEHLVLRPLISNCPCGYAAWISSSHPIQTMSRLQYLVEKLGWSQSRLSFDYPFLNKGLLYLLFKIDLFSEDPQGVMIKVSAADPNILQYAKLILIDRDVSSNELNYTFLDISTLKTQRLSFNPNTKGYRLILVVFTPGNLSEGVISVDILTRNNDSLKTTPGEMMDPIEFCDKYTPNKYGIIFKEQLFVPEEVNFSIHVRMRKGGMPVPGGKGKEISPEEPLQSLHLILLEVYDGEELIVATKGYNQGIIPHLNLKTSSKELLIVCKYDIDEWPDCKSPINELQDVNWVLRVISSDTIALVKDTRKEDKEDSIRKSWEASQIGRSELAKQSRQRYLAYVKSVKGDELNDHEKEILKETWQERRKSKKESEAPGKGKPKGKEDKKQKDQEKIIVTEIEIPNPDDHVMIPIKTFLNHIQKDRLIKIESNEKILFTVQQIDQTKQKIKNEILAYNESYQQKKNNILQEKAKLDALKESFKDVMNNKKEALEHAVLAYKDARTIYQNKIEIKKKPKDEKEIIIKK